ncbi:Dapper like 1, partial [Dissostichus eleginoides]
MPLSVPSRRDTDGRCSRDRTAVDADVVDAAERQRAVRERQEAAASGLQELEFLRQRQERLVRGALELREEEVEEEEEKETQLNSEEKILEENILLLRKQLNCLRRRDAGLITQLQELDRQISDLRLDTEASHDQLENDSRPSSGFYELSDGASGSLSNSSNSVFSECFCSMAEADGRLISADERASCLECDGLVGGLFDDSSFSGTVRRSLSAPHPVTLDPLSSVASCDSQSKYHCDLVAKNGSEVYRYPSPLHAVAVQTPVFLQMLGPIRDEGPSSSWPATFSSQTPSLKRLDSYIFSLLQRRALPVRTSRPRTSISTDPSKSILRQASLCVRQVSGFGFGTLRGSEFRPSWPAGGASAESLSPQRQWSVESKPEEQETQNFFPDVSVETMQNGFKMNSDLAENQNSSTHSICIQNGSSVTHIDTSTNSLLKQKSKGLLPPSAVSTLPKDFRELGIPKANSSPKETQQPCYFPDQDLLLKSPAVIKTSSATPKNSPKPLQNVQTEKVERSKKYRLLEDGASINIKVSKRAPGGGSSHGMNSSRIKRLPASIPEGRVLDKHDTSTLGSVRSGRDQVAVVAKPKHKRNDYRRLRAIMELQYDEAFRRAQRRQRKELLNQSAANVYLPSAGQVSSPYSYVARSDSEYSAECASLFHSTIVDTSEDERSNYTTTALETVSPVKRNTSRRSPPRVTLRRVEEV